MNTIEHILCPVDFSQTSEAALRYAIDLAQDLKADITLAYVTEPPVYPVPEGPVFPTAHWTTIISDDGKKRMDQWMARFQEGCPVPLKKKLIEGKPHVEISQIAESVGADLIIMGTHGRTGMSRLLLGSVAERVLRTAKVPVLTVHAPSKEAA